MRISPITSYCKTTHSYATNPASNSKKKSTLPVQKAVERSIYDKGSYKLSFGETLIHDYLYEKSLPLHEYAATQLSPRTVEDYFNSQGIPCSLRLGSDKAQHVIGYCCMNTAEIFKQINHPSIVLPTQINMEEIINPDGSYPIAVCYYGPNTEKGFPIRTVAFNPVYDWENHMRISKPRNIEDKGFHVSGHFLETFLHEFGHNVHYHHLFSKFGCPFQNDLYPYNSNAGVITEALNMKVFDNNGNDIPNPHIIQETRKILQKTSGYGKTLLPETFAEEFARAIINCMNPVNLRLTEDPFPIMTAYPGLNAVLYETWEGLIADGQGYVV